MANQYFENNPNLAHNIQKINFYYMGKKITYFSDNGVFSKGNIDYGSNALLKNISIKKGAKILDVGCGYGTIGLSLAMVDSTSDVTLIDVNQRAIDLTSAAIKENGITNANSFISDRYEKINEQFDVIISNPPIRAGKNIVHDIILGAYKYLKENGSMWCVIQKKQGAPSAFSALQEKYSQVNIIEKDKGYWIIEAIK